MIKSEIFPSDLAECGRTKILRGALQSRPVKCRESADVARFL